MANALCIFVYKNTIFRQRSLKLSTSAESKTLGVTDLETVSVKFLSQVQNSGLAHYLLG